MSLGLEEVNMWSVLANHLVSYGHDSTAICGALAASCKRRSRPKFESCYESGRETRGAACERVQPCYLGHLGI
jgi:hypothetical protein